MAADDAGEEIDRAIDGEEPGEKEMPPPSCREILFSRPCHESRKAALLRLAVLILRDPEPPGRIERMAGNPGYSACRLLVRGRHRQEGLREVGLASPIKSRMGIEDLQPAHEQKNPGERVDPMRHADDQSVPANCDALGCWAAVKGEL